MSGRHWAMWLAVALITGIAVLACSRKQTVVPKSNPVDGALMVYVPGGRFLMGSDEAGTMDIERPQHSVNLPGFWIYQTVVTNSQYRQCIAAGQCDGTLSDHPDDDYPAASVTWQRAKAYCEWAGGRLPTEAEWEKAARGVDGRRYPWGNAEPSCDKANFADCKAGLMPVGSHPDGASPYGALDMAGNVWEWVEDQYREEYYAPAPPEADDDDDRESATAIYDWRILRGGSHLSSANELRTSYRNWARTDEGSMLYGFRCALD